MTRPDSLLSRFRRRLVTWIEPYPDAGEAWCMDCALNGDRTLIVPADGTHKHLEAHRKQAPGKRVVMHASWHQTRREEP